MSRYEHIRIFQCAYMLTIEIYKTTGNFSREFKYTLGEKLKNAAHDILDAIMRINSLPTKKNKNAFQKLILRKKIYAFI